MDMKKTAIICCACAVVIGAGFYAYSYVSEKAAVEKFNEDQKSLAEKDSNYATLLEMISKANSFDEVNRSAEFVKFFNETCPENSVQAKYLTIAGLESAPIVRYTEYASKLDYYGNKVADTIYHVKTDLHTSDNLTKLLFDFTKYGLTAELNIANCYKTKEATIPEDAEFTLSPWKHSMSRRGYKDVCIKLQDYNGTTGDLFVHVSPIYGAFVVVRTAKGGEALDKVTTLSVQNMENYVTKLEGRVIQDTIFQITDTELATKTFYDTSGEIYLTLITTDSRGKSRTFSQRWDYPNIWAAYLDAADLKPAFVFEQMSDGRDFQNVCRDASLKKVEFDLPKIAAPKK